MTGGELINLLCIIHRDGGQYLQQHGLEKAYADAVDILHRWKTLPDELTEAQKQNAMMREALEKIAHSRVGKCESIAEELFKREAWAEEALDATKDLSGLILCEAEREACKQVATLVSEMVDHNGTQWERGWFEAATRIAEDIGDRK